MCGFAGVIAWDERYRCSAETLAKMSAAIAHRGPDGEGFHVNHNGPITPDHPQVSLAFRRLAILDPDPRSMQPFTDGRHWLVFNGEIYNFRELKKELSMLRPDYTWRTTGDTEVLLSAYAEWGEKCVEHLNGMFAFAVWDEVEKSLFLARDRMGQKPLYVAAPQWPWNSVLAFGSEIGALRTLAWFPRETSEYNITEFLRYGYTPAEETAFELCLGLGRYWNTFRWNASAGAAMSSGGEPYFDPNEGSARTSDPVVTTRDLVRQAVRRQLVSDVPLGVFLSGGIDSSVIAASARREGPVQTFSISFDDPRYDETEFAESVSRHLGTHHCTFRVTPDAVRDLPALVAAFGTPFGDSSALPTHYLVQETRKHVKVALSGDGGDELFGGYDRYRAMRLGRKLVPLAVGPVLPMGAAWHS